jgi:hypothetical protein
MTKITAEIRREKLRNRSKQAVQTRDQKGLGRKSVLDWSRFVGKKPAAFKVRAGKDKKNLIDFLPWKVTQSWYKDLRTFSGLTTNLDVGDWDYKLEVPVHKNVGENNDTFLCLRLAFGGKCPRCEEMFEEYEKSEPNEKKINALKPSWRCWYNVYDYDEETNPDGDIQIWEDVSYHNIEKEILNEADEGEEPTLYSDIEIGKSVEIEGRTKKLGKNEFIEAKNVKFKDRDPYDESIVEETVSFDALVKICTYDEFARAHLGLDSDDISNDSDDISNDSNDFVPSESPKENEKALSLPTGRRRRRRNISKEEAISDDPSSQKESEKCPDDLEFGAPDIESEKCKNCPDDMFEKCVELSDKKAEQEIEPQTRSRRHRIIKR